MIVVQSWDKARATRRARRTDTFEGHVTDFIATLEERVQGAQAFLVEQDPDWATPPHFHLEQQFQVVTAGGGSIGRHPVSPYAVHYAAPETGYGPITAGPEGISYLTLRAQGDTGAWYLHKPGSRERMRPGLKREQQHGMPSNFLSEAEITALSEPTVEDLIPPRADGLAAHLVRMGPGTKLKLPALHANAGRHHVVTKGSMKLGGQTAAAFSVAFAAADEAYEFESGNGGVEIIVLQFPKVSAKPESTT
jgi:hypothetical protein